MKSKKKVKFSTVEIIRVKNLKRETANSSYGSAPLFKIYNEPKKSWLDSLLSLFSCKCCNTEKDYDEYEMIFT